MRIVDQVRKARISVLQGRHIIDAHLAEHPLVWHGGLTVHGSTIAWQYATEPVGSDHLIYATSVSDDVCLGLLSASQCAAGRDPFLMLRSVQSRADLLGDTLPRRMLGALLLRLIAMDELPSALVARSSDDVTCDLLLELSCRCRSTELYPEPGSNIVPLRTAALLHRIARAARMPVRDPHWREHGLGGPATLVTLDLRTVDQDALGVEADRLYRTRMPRARTKASG